MSDAPIAPPLERAPRFHAGHAIALHMVIEMAREWEPTGNAEADANVRNALLRAREVQDWLEPLVHGAAALVSPRVEPPKLADLWGIAPELAAAPRVETEGDAAREKLRKAIRFEWGRRESDSWAWALIEEAFDLIPKPRPSGWYHEADEKLYEATMSEPPRIPLVANAAIPPGEVHVKVDGKTVAKIVGLDLSSRPPVDPKEGT